MNRPAALAGALKCGQLAGAHLDLLVLLDILVADQVAAVLVAGGFCVLEGGEGRVEHVGDVGAGAGVNVCLGHCGRRANAVDTAAATAGGGVDCDMAQSMHGQKAQTKAGGLLALAGTWTLAHERKLLRAVGVRPAKGVVIRLSGVAHSAVLARHQAVGLGDAAGLVHAPVDVVAAGGGGHHVVDP